MEEYRFKIVRADGSHYFSSCTTSKFPYYIASTWAEEESVKQVDIYRDSKLIATFYH